MLPPPSKVRRELLRIWYQIADPLGAPLDAWRRWRHDRRFASRVAVTDGACPARPKLALFLIHQPGTVSPTIALSCAELVRKGYAVLLVSNTPVAPDAVAALRPLCWKIAVRPNFGYDFGGYRDGLRLIREAGVEPQVLLILNDSVWFPTLPDSRLLDRLETGPDAFAGAVYVDNPRRGPANRHFQSFLLVLRAEALRSAAFRRYWRHCRVSSTKRLVLRHGEKGFSQAMFAAGFGGTGHATAEVLGKALASQSDAFLRKTLSYAAYGDAALLAEARALLARGDAADWRARTLDHMARALATQSPIGVFVYASTLLLDLCFLKKRSFADTFDGMRWQYLRAVENGDLPALPPEIREEIQASRMNPAITTDPAQRARA